MIVEIIDKLGTTPLRIPCSQVRILNDVGTPIGVAGEYGPNLAVRIAHAGEPDFNRTLAALGYCGSPVSVDRLNAPTGDVPAGASLISAPV
jgi:hypothetical protein